ncbi:hypothetical protein ACWEPL_06300 [Nonomuraea sp. NPDC004186]|uniref:hypothetical protein n=1 Tax=Nonomuraea sp. NPDC049625 TaxID=3155775 RepID=UPI003412E8A8
MADHDRDAGSRGEEEAPRDPTPDDDLHESGARSRLKYGEAPPGPGFTMPLAPPRHPDSYREFFRQKQAQVLGAGLIGLVIGALLGGTAVAVVSGFAHRDEVHGMYWQEPDRMPRRFQVPERLDDSACEENGKDRVFCSWVVPKAPRSDVPPAPIPVPTSSG